MKIRRIVEELCTQADCERPDTHWHAFDVDSLRDEEDGEYTLTLRVRTLRGSGARGRRRHGT